MWVEFAEGENDYDILFAAEFESVPRVGESVSEHKSLRKYRVTEVEYVIMDAIGSKVAAVCTVALIDQAEGE